jgi:hypothetical protein
MASAYDEIKKVLVMLRQGEPITEQSRAELNRVRRFLEQELATAEMTANDLPSSILEPHATLPNGSLAREATES